MSTILRAAVDSVDRSSDTPFELNSSIGFSSSSAGTVDGVPGPFTSLSPVRNLKDLRAAVRHGEAVTVRRVNPAVITAVATSVAAVKSASVPASTSPKAAVWQRVEQRASLVRDTTRLTAAVTGIAAAVFFTGEIITTPAVTMLSLLPALIVLTKSAECSAIMEALRSDAARGEALRNRANIRRRWITTVKRSSRVLTRSLANPHALYETPQYGKAIRVMRRRPLNVTDVARLEDALQRAENVEHIISESRSRIGVNLPEVVRRGWSTSILYWRRILVVGAIASLGNTVLLCTANRPVAAVISGLATSGVLGIRYFISAYETRRVDFTIRRQSMRLRYPDLMTEVDNVIQEEIDRLITAYTTGLDVDIDPFEDLEPQLRRQIDTAIAYGTENERQIHDVLDLRPLRDSYRPSSN